MKEKWVIVNASLEPDRRRKPLGAQGQLVDAAVDVATATALVAAVPRNVDEQLVAWTP